MITKGLGFIESGVNPNDTTYAAPKIELPKRYELREQLRVYDQGSKGELCVLYSCKNVQFLLQIKRSGTVYRLRIPV